MARTGRPWPRRVILSHGRYFYKTRIDGRQRLLPLTRTAEGEAALYAKLAEIYKPTARTVRELIESFLISGSDDLKPRTVKNYVKDSAPVIAVFGHMLPSTIDSGHVAQYLEARKKQGAAVSANREVAVLSSAINYGMRQGWLKANPCRGVRRNRERPRTRHIRDDEFLAVFEAQPEHVQDLLAIAYLTGLRQGDLRVLRRDQIGRDGITIEESKTGKRRVILWSDALAFFVRRAQERAPDSPYLLTNSRGEPWSEWGIQSVMRRLKVDWTFHDLRAKAESDHETGLGLLSRYKRSAVVRPVR